jgi:hypothetical protein
LGTFYGGAGEENVKGVKTDYNKDVYIFGEYKKCFNIATTGSYQSTLT